MIVGVVDCVNLVYCLCFVSSVRVFMYLVILFVGLYVNVVFLKNFGVMRCFSFEWCIVLWIRLFI